MITSVSLARLYYKMQLYVRAVKPAADVLVAKGFLNRHHIGDKVSYAILQEGINFVEFKNLVKIR